MQTDLYTKSVLTVIAASLTWLCVQPVFAPTPASAQATQKVVLVGIEGTSLLAHGRPALPVNIVAVTGK
jgi:hypothetical protein